MTPLAERFLRYVRIDTTSDSDSDSSPSTGRQLKFLGLLKDELIEMGMENVELDPLGTLYASVPGPGSGDTVIGLLAHVDTSPEAPGANVEPVLHRNWDGAPIELAEGVTIDPDETEAMGDYEGGTIITSDGTTLLGADDKAGVAIIMEVCSKLIRDPSFPSPPVRVAFTTDEEVGRGMDNFDTAVFGADLAYTVDGSSTGKVDTETFNAYAGKWTVKGREVHPGSAKGIMVNAVRIISDIVSSLPPEEMPENSSEKEGYCYPMSVQAVTSSGTLDMIVRDFDSEGMKARIEKLRKLEQWITSRYPGADIELNLKQQYRNPAEILRSDRRGVEYALRGTDAAGMTPVESSIRGGTDGSRLSFMGVPTVNLPTGGELFHSRKEWVAAEGLEQAFRTVLETLKIWGEEA
ncbi:MAG: peptidase T [Candidatus Aegiribacteria sp.]|nr:peptidase T [Candidatus Aegiribacteria sp.]MBD3295345.1 peptidase T [Candidatus Fermentibacteria bacterium]